MSNFEQIQGKLQQFIKKYYTNELIKGLFLFFSIGFIYFFITLLIEYFLWLKPLGRTVLFVLFIIVELALLIFYIVVPIFRIYGFNQGINEFQASKIIGDHFPEVGDKLLNMIQLNNVEQNSELVEASIEQKSNNLKLVPFRRAIDFSKNKKYIKYALLPIVIWGLVYLTGNITIFNNSFSRVVDYNTQYLPPAPFSFKVLNTSFNVVEGQSFVLNVETIGDVIPEEAKIYFDRENYYLKNNGIGNFEYTFSNISRSLDFFIVANGVQSKIYSIKVLKTPLISNFTMILNYPDYTGKVNEVVKNTGNVIVPQGTNITWQVQTFQTDEVSFHLKNSISAFKKPTKDFFNYNRKILNSINYKITSSNKELKNYESLNYSIEVVTDEFPKISVKSDIDSIAYGPAQFVGDLSDDYALHKLELVYYDKKNPSSLNKLSIPFDKGLLAEFYYVFPNGISIVEGVEYEMYFQVFDNDVVNGNKKAKSRKFSYYNQTLDEVKEVLLKEQKATLNSISKSLEKSKKENSEINNFKDQLQKKADINWSDTKKLEEFVKRQNQYQQMFEEQTDELDKNLKEQPVSESLKEKKAELQKRIDEAKKIAKEDELLKELNKLSEKMEKEDLVEKLNDLGKKNKQKEQSLERLLELTKRFYVEQKSNQISANLAKLAQKQEELSNKKLEENTIEKQEEINKEFDSIKKDFQDLDKENKDLKRPMKLPDNKDASKEVSEDLEKASEDLKQEQKKSAKNNQKSAAQKMKKMSKSMEQSAKSMEMEMVDENIEDLRKIVENLIEFSFQQEDLMEEISSGDNNSPAFPKQLKKQYVLKEYFEHIDDSLYMLSLRLVKMGSGIQKEVTNVHFNLDETLSNLVENRLDQSEYNQYSVITSVNILANQLSDLLESLMNASASMGKGKGKGKPSGFSLPDIIKKQGELSDQMKEGMKKGEKPGSKKGEGKQEQGESDSLGEEMNGELFEIYKQQSQLREMLKNMLGEQPGKSKRGADVLKQMEELERVLLEKGFSNDIVKQMQQLNYELLKLEEAKVEQGEDDQRKSESNINEFKQFQIDSLDLKKLYYNNNEILKRQSLPLRSIYKKKVQEYFNKSNTNDSIQLRN